MKIGWVAPGGFDRSGRERIVPALLWLLARLACRHEVHVFTLYQYPHPCHYPLLGATVHNLGPSGHPFHIPRLLLRGLHALQQEHVRRPFDVLHGFWARESGLIATAAGRWLHVPTVVMPLGGELVGLPDIGFGSRLSRRDRFWIGWTFRLATVPVVASNYMRRLLHPIRPDAQVIPLGVDTSLFTPPDTPPPDGPPWRLLHIGNLNRVKDQPTLLRAFQQMCAFEPAMHLDIIGEDTLNGAIQRLAAELGVAEAVTFHGFLPSETVVQRLQQAHLLLHSSRFEAGQMVTLEAAACGVPTVGTNVGHVADLAPEAAVAVPVNDPPALAHAALSLLRDGERRRAIGRQALAWARAHDADWTADRFEVLYTRLRNPDISL